MAGSFYNNNNDSMDISELASLNNDISDDLINHLQNQLSENMATPFTEGANTPPVNENDDATLFEESSASESTTEKTSSTSQIESASAESAPAQTSNENKESVSVNINFDDNFIKKYKAKLNKKANSDLEQSNNHVASSKESSSETSKDSSRDSSRDSSKDSSKDLPSALDTEPIENISQGNITEKPLTRELIDYNDSLDFLDGNVKYSKYVIYIDPENVDFIEGLTVKERKNLVNKILRQQDDISITKQRFQVIQTIIRQLIIAVLTIAISVPVVYYVINASLEITIDNYRRSQNNWQVLYREHGKITKH